jgi:predicted phosphatase
MTKIKTSNVHYDQKLQHYSQIRQYVAHVVSVGAHMDLSMLTNIINMTRVSHKN